MRRTVVVQGSSYDLGSNEAAEVAQSWLADHPEESDRFMDEFPGAQVVASIGGHRKYPHAPCYYVFGDFSQFDAGYIPSARVVFALASGQTGTVLRNLPQLGVFPSSNEAMDAAKKAKIEILSNGRVIFECERS